mmetsp:Transcript_71006/g.98658  ORF Transcript_71006/g.98658 Transcript_71006/m.98658 type:complete len:249 (+) Transcript_71006:441-1187(+)
MTALSVKTSQDDLTEVQGLSVLRDVLNEAVELVVVEVDEGIVSSKLELSQRELDLIAESEGLVVQDNLVVEEVVLDVGLSLNIESDMSIAGLALVLGMDVTGDGIELLVGLDLGKEVESLTQVIFSEVGPESDAVVGVEFGLDVSASDVGDVLNLAAASNGILLNGLVVDKDGLAIRAILGDLLEVKDFLTGNLESLTLSGVLQSQELAVDKVIEDGSLIIQVEGVESGLGGTSGLGGGVQFGLLSGH